MFLRNEKMHTNTHRCTELMRIATRFRKRWRLRRETGSGGCALGERRRAAYFSVPRVPWSHTMASVAICSCVRGQGSMA